MPDWIVECKHKRERVAVSVGMKFVVKELCLIQSCWVDLMSCIRCPFRLKGNVVDSDLERESPHEQDAVGDDPQF